MKKLEIKKLEMARSFEVEEKENGENAFSGNRGSQ